MELIVIDSKQQKGRDHLGDLSVDGRITSKWFLKEDYFKVWTGLIWFRIESRSELL
jgi:hypothetical protein